MTQADKPEAQVVSIGADGRKRVHFAGLLDDARTFVERNFPRPHVEPGSNQDLRADAHVESRDHGNLVFHGEGSGGSEGWFPADEHGYAKDTTQVQEPAPVDPPVEPQE